MDINHLINRLKRFHHRDWEQFKTIFYEEKLKEIQYTPKTELASAVYKKVCSMIIGQRSCQNTQINKDLTYSIVFDRIYFVFKGIYEDSIRIPISLWSETKEKLLEIVKSIPNEEYQKIVDSFPKWNEEFKTVCRENYRQVEKILLEKCEPVRAVNRYLELKIELMQVLCNGEQGATAYDLKALGLPVEKKDDSTYFDCKNITIEMNGLWKDIEMRFVIDDYTIWLHLALPIKTILEIDRSIPQWIEEAKVLQHELEKQKKTKQIGENAVTVLAKKLMRESGYEYQLDEGLLEIKLLHDRKLVASLPSKLAKAKLKLSRIPQSVAAINSVPEEYEIKGLSRTDMRAVGEATPDVNSRMKQLGYNYSCYYDFPKSRTNKFGLLEVIVQLPKNRELVLRKSKTPKSAAQVLDEMPAYIAAINSVPHYFRIRKALQCDKWAKES